MTQLKKISVRTILMLTLSGIVNAVGVTLFLYPVKLYDSGISGTSMLLAQITPASLSVFLLLLNVPLFLYGMKKQGLTFTVQAIYAVCVYSLTSWLITDVLPINVSFASPLAGTDLLLCALFGGCISGVGSGLAIRFGGAMDGIEVMAVIFAKRLGITVGNFCMVYNVLLYVICGAVLHSWILPLYSVVTYSAALKTVDFIVEGIDRAKSAMIVTEKPNEVCAALSKAFGSGTTRIAAMGGYSGVQKTVIFFVVHRFGMPRMRQIVHEIDEGAFITISDVADVFSANHTK